MVGTRRRRYCTDICRSRARYARNTGRPLPAQPTPAEIRDLTVYTVLSVRSAQYAATLASRLTEALPPLDELLCRVKYDLRHEDPAALDGLAQAETLAQRLLDGIRATRAAVKVSERRVA